MSADGRYLPTVHVAAWGNALGRWEPRTFVQQTRTGFRLQRTAKRVLFADPRRNENNKRKTVRYRDQPFGKRQNGGRVNDKTLGRGTALPRNVNVRLSVTHTHFYTADATFRFLSFGLFRAVRHTKPQ